MNLNFLKIPTLVLAAVALSVGASRAQDFQGSFTLAHQTQLGNVVLQPGDYTLTLTRFPGGQREVKVQADADGSTEAILLPASQESSPSLRGNDLVCLREGGTLVVSALEVGPLGETDYFHMPEGAELYALNRGESPTLLAEAPQHPVRVPVSYGGN